MTTHSSYPIYYADSLSRYLEIIRDINAHAQHGKKSEDIARMWYRGHEKDYYTLLPTLFRSKAATEDFYGYNHLREDMRYQHFRSKNTHLVTTSPESKIEWQEILQHHFGKTRLLDWSESAISSLMFALEAFIDPKNDRELNHRRMNMTPTVWVLDAKRLNQHIFAFFRGHQDYIETAVRDVLGPTLDGSPAQVQLTASIKEQLDYLEDFFEDDREHGINGVVCLSVIEGERRANTERLYNMLLHREFNPFFYLLLRFYNDGIPVPMDTLPPLAIVHPYHSRRIEYQHGVFTIVPHYQIEKKQCGTVYDLRPMENQSSTQDCLFRINITRPAKVAKELLMMGTRRVDLYPDIEVYVRDMEAQGWGI